MFRSGRVHVALGVFVILAACLAAGPVLGAETLLITARETVDGKPAPPPLPSVEGASGSLFDKGHIVFDAGIQPAGTRSAALVERARSGGAGWVLEIEVAYTEKPAGEGLTRVEGSAKYTLIDTSTGATSLSGSVSGTNAGREKTVDRKALGMELGRLVTDKVARAIPAPAL